jgi:hypothetical protein
MGYQWPWNDGGKNGWKIKFYPNENIEWHCMQLNFNSIQFHFIPNSIEFNSIESKNIELEFNWIQIQLKKNKMKIGVRRYWNFLVIFIICDYDVEFLKYIIINLWKDTNLGKKKNTFPLHSNHIPNQNLFWWDKTYWLQNIKVRAFFSSMSSSLQDTKIYLTILYGQKDNNNINYFEHVVSGVGYSWLLLSKISTWLVNALPHFPNSMFFNYLANAFL